MSIQQEYDDAINQQHGKGSEMLEEPAASRRRLVFVNQVKGTSLFQSRFYWYVILVFLCFPYKQFHTNVTQHW